MGLDINAVQFLIAARKAGVDLGDVLMVGRQDLNVYPVKMRRVLSKANLPAELFAPGAPDTGYAEPVFKSLGARNVWSLDASNFEKAEFVHDLNQPVPEALKGRFDTVYDGGTLEHVFNFPVALQNCMEMVKPGGQFFMHTCANNWCGHGFYQFSPELFYSALSEENGFVVERMVLHVAGPYGRWYEVANPRAIRSRVELINWCPLQMLVRARRTKAVPIFATAPQQSDYTPRWTDRQVPKSGNQESEKRKADGHASVAGEPQPEAVSYTPSRPGLAKVLPGLARLAHVIKIAWILWRSHSIRNRGHFRPVRKGEP